MHRAGRIKTSGDTKVDSVRLHGGGKDLDILQESLLLGHAVGLQRAQHPRRDEVAVDEGPEHAAEITEQPLTRTGHLYLTTRSQLEGA